ncbi:hypothetical protein CC80DRAFT_536417 [Byssothecium circinans]|uniref:Inhibitor I9 domain-containing protein n=1 Tax=Byssothecium circinans TaxID=147558 RepID=A0A6A5U1A0_9PLEO|nr:hypothetical protein CC80DRAFT_536417 [Byssothecium circinans]
MKFINALVPALIGAASAAPVRRDAQNPTLVSVTIPDDVLATVEKLPGLEVVKAQDTTYLLFTKEYTESLKEKRGTSIADADAGFNNLYILRAEADAQAEAKAAAGKRGTSIADTDSGFNSLYILRAEADAQTETEAATEKRGTSISDADAGFNSLYILRAEADAQEAEVSN